MEINRANEIMTANLSPKIEPGRRKIGLEEEYIAVDPKGYSITVNKMLSSLRRIGEELRLSPEDNGMSWKSTEDSIYKVTVGTDMGAGQLELGLAPEYSLTAARESLVKVLNAIIPILAKEEVYLLGLGIQPLSAPSWEMVMPKPRYKVLGDRYNTNNVLAPPLTDVLLNALTASHQVHIDVSLDEAIRLLRLYYLMTPEIIALCGNSGIVGGKPIILYGHEVSDYRELIWDKVVAHPRDLYRKGIPKSLPVDMDHYIHMLLSLQPLLTKRNGEYLAYLNDTKSMYEHIVKGSWARNLNSDRIRESVRIELEPVDIYAHSSLVWWTARIKPDIGTVEIRSCAQQPDIDSTIAVSAWLWGLAESRNSEVATERIGHRHASQLRGMRWSSIDSGLNTMIGPAGSKNIICGETPISESIKDLLDISAAGLIRLGEDPSLLDPLYMRLDRKKNPSDESKEILRKEGIEGLIELRRLARV